MVAGSPGEFGAKVKTPPELMELKKEKFKINQFNLLVSEMISVNRSLKDVRMSGCKQKTYPLQLPTTSIIIVFHNEAWTTLLRHGRVVMERGRSNKTKILQDAINQSLH